MNKLKNNLCSHQTSFISSDCVVFLCGEHSSKSKGMAAEFSITREEKKPYFLLCGRRKKIVEKPKNSGKNDKIYPWRWNTLKKLLDGERDL